jgi:KDO2-lipid IV(A) lauroyltransferase
LGYRKKVVLGNLQLVFPEKSDKERKTIAKRFYLHLCDLIFETIKNITISEKQIDKRFQFENLDLLHRYNEENKSVLLMCGHYANWEWSGILTRHMEQKGYAVYKPLANPYFDTMVKKIRGRFGATIISNKNVTKELFKNAKRGINSVTLILSDQTPKPGAYKYRDTFMDIDVPVFTGTEELAKKLDFIPVYLQVKKVKRGYYSSRFVPLTESPVEHQDFEITRMFLNELESQIRETPQYYLWSHKRWKLRN